MEELWKAIEGYEGKYEVSNYGRIKSYAQNKQGKITLGYTDHKGYKTIYLYDKPQCGKWYKVHRLVASAFISNPNNLPQINHKDEDKSNNAVDNLEWCTNDYNIHYGTRILRATESNRCCETTSMKVCSVDANGCVEYFDSINEAERQTGISNANISRTLKGRTKHAGKREWYYINCKSPTTTERKGASTKLAM
jgi:hypothetical protein